MGVAMMTSSRPSALPRAAYKGRVLLVDDEQAILRAYARLLSAQGYDVETAPSASAALDALSKCTFDVILSDLTMPEMTGIELLRRVRQIDAELPFILVTAAATTQTALDAMEHGALRYLLKPIDSDALSRALEDAMRVKKMSSERKLAAAIAHDSDSKRIKLEQAFNRALEGLYMAYQPIVSYSTKSVYGYEALVRSSEKELPHPGALFDAAEELGYVHALGRQIRSVIPKAADSLPPDVKLFVNLHTRDLADATLFEAGAPLSRFAPQVVLEITERVSLADVDEAHNRVQALRDMGFRIAIDDIGAGYAGLTSFALLEPDVVKLDMELIRDIDAKKTKQKVVRAMVTLCRELNIALIAEGVETTPPSATCWWSSDAICSRATCSPNRKRPSATRSSDRGAYLQRCKRRRMDS